MEISFAHFGIEDPLYQTCLKIREEVLRRPLGMVLRPQDIEKDGDATHIICFVGGKPAGSVTLLNDGTLTQMAVIEEFRGFRIGSKLVARLEELAKEKGLGEVKLASRDYAIPFYEKSGYTAYGDFHEKVGIPHKMMRKWI